MPPPGPANLSGQWRFTPNHKDYLQSDLIDPTMVYRLVQNQDYRAYLMGDVDGSKFSLNTARPITADSTKVSMPSMNARPGQSVVVPMRIDKLADQQVLAYNADIAYDPAVVTPQDIAADITGTNAANLSVVYNPIEPGLLKVAVYGALPATGDGVYLNLNFTATGREGAVSPISIRQFILNDGSQGVNTEDGRIMIGETAATGSLTGRLVTADGQGLRNATVIATDTAGRQIRTLSSAFGAFRFNGMVQGQTYVIQVSSKRYKFQDRTVTYTSSLTDLGDLVALE